MLGVGSETSGPPMAFRLPQSRVGKCLEAGTENRVQTRRATCGGTRNPRLEHLSASSNRRLSASAPLPISTSTCPRTTAKLSVVFRRTPLSSVMPHDALTPETGHIPPVWRSQGEASGRRHFLSPSLVC